MNTKVSKIDKILYNMDLNPNNKIKEIAKINKLNPSTISRISGVSSSACHTIFNGKPLALFNYNKILSAMKIDYKLISQSLGLCKRIKPNIQDIGLYISSLRRDRDFSKSVVANHFGITLATYTSIEKGNIKRLTANRIFKIIKFLDPSYKGMNVYDPFLTAKMAMSKSDLSTSQLSKHSKTTVDTIRKIYQNSTISMKKYSTVMHTLGFNDEKILKTLGFPSGIKNNSSSIGKYIRKIRKEKGISVKEIAKKINTTTTTIYLIEENKNSGNSSDSSKNSNPFALTLYRILKTIKEY